LDEIKFRETSFTAQKAIVGHTDADTELTKDIPQEPIAAIDPLPTILAETLAVEPKTPQSNYILNKLQ